MTADHIFATLVYLTMPAAIAYPLLYATKTKWWLTWVGQALLVKALGILLLLTFSALFYGFGPGYWGRDVVRIAGMVLLTVGIHYALIAMLREFAGRPSVNEEAS